MSGVSLLKDPFKEEIQLKTKSEILRLSRAGSTAASILREVGKYVRPGITTASLERICEERVAHYSRTCSIRKYPDFPAYLSISVNDTAVHGLPNQTVLRNGDVVTLDLVLSVDGWYGDTALTIPVGTVSPRHARLVETARAATEAGIRQIRAGIRMGDIGKAIQGLVKDAGFELFEGLVGHGIGKELHEGPTVYMKGEAGIGRPIVPGMVFTVEPVITEGLPEYYIAEDGFSLLTRDGKYTALFEHTVAVLSDEVIVITDPDRRRE